MPNPSWKNLNFPWPFNPDLFFMRIISGKHRHRKLKSPKGDLVRPTSDYLRELIFNLLQGQVEGAHFLDLFAGSGAVGLEALSRGAALLTAVEQVRHHVSILKSNVEMLEAQKETKIIVGDAISTLNAFAKQNICFDIIFADPPYAKRQETFPFSEQVLKIVDEYPLLKPSGLLILEDSLDKQESQLVLNRLYLKDERKAGKTQLRIYEEKL